MVGCDLAADVADVAEAAVRDATSADLDALMSLEQACFPAALAFSEWEYREMLTHAGDVKIVAEEDGRPVGFVHAIVHRARRVGQVFTVHVHPDARRRGLGAALMDACEARLAAAGARRVTLHVNVRNEAAIAMYERRGYARAGRAEGYYSGYDDPAAFVYSKELR